MEKAKVIVWGLFCTSCCVSETQTLLLHNCRIRLKWPTFNQTRIIRGKMHVYNLTGCVQQVVSSCSASLFGAICVNPESQSCSSRNSGQIVTTQFLGNRKKNFWDQCSRGYLRSETRSQNNGFFCSSVFWHQSKVFLMKNITKDIQIWSVPHRLPCTFCVF